MRPQFHLLGSAPTLVKWLCKLLTSICSRPSQDLQAYPTQCEALRNQHQETWMWEKWESPVHSACQDLTMASFFSSPICSHGLPTAEAVLHDLGWASYAPTSYSTTLRSKISCSCAIIIKFMIVVLIFHCNRRLDTRPSSFRARAGDAIHSVLWLVKGRASQTTPYREAAAIIW